MRLFDKTKKNQDSSIANCPHCGVSLDPVPKRKTKCRACGNDIYVRTDPFNNDPFNKKRIYYLKHEDALSMDVVKNLPISGREYYETEKELAKKFGKPPMPGDIVWGILNNHLVTAMQLKDWQNMKMAYWYQARLLFESGQDYFRLRQESVKCELRRYQSQGVKRVEVLANGGCEKCKSLNSKVFAIKEALDTMPIPVKECENGWCRCTYTAVID